MIMESVKRSKLLVWLGFFVIATLAGIVVSQPDAWGQQQPAPDEEPAWVVPMQDDRQRAIPVEVVNDQTTVPPVAVTTVWPGFVRVEGSFNPGGGIPVKVETPGGNGTVGIEGGNILPVDVQGPGGAPIPIDGGNPNPVDVQLAPGAAIPIDGGNPNPVDVQGPGGAPIDVHGPGGGPIDVQGPGGGPIDVQGPGGAPIPIDGGNPNPIDVQGPGGAAIPIDGGNPNPVDVQGPGGAAIDVQTPGGGGKVQIEGGNAAAVQVAPAPGARIPIDGGNPNPVNVQGAGGAPLQIAGNVNVVNGPANQNVNVTNANLNVNANVTNAKLNVDVQNFPTVQDVKVLDTPRAQIMKRIRVEPEEPGQPTPVRQIVSEDGGFGQVSDQDVISVTSVVIQNIGDPSDDPIDPPDGPPTLSPVQNPDAYSTLFIRTCEDAAFDLAIGPLRTIANETTTVTYPQGLSFSNGVTIHNSGNVAAVVSITARTDCIEIDPFEPPCPAPPPPP